MQTACLLQHATLPTHHYATHGRTKMPVFADVSLSSYWRRRREIGEAWKWRAPQHTESTSPISTVRNSDNCFAWRLMHRNADSVGDQQTR
jgi:hypothetical protein